MLKKIFMFTIILSISLLAVNESVFANEVVFLDKIKSIFQKNNEPAPTIENELPYESEEILIEEKEEEKPKDIPIDYESLKVNEIGEIMILMYHGLDPYKATADYQRTVDGFRNDLQKLYEGGFRPVPLRDLIYDQVSVEAGYTPFVFTFDDALSTAFSFEEVNGELVPAKDCAVQIMNEFAEQYPDFGKAGVFYMSGDDRPPFHGAGTLEERCKYLIDNGYEIGNHTFTHDYLNALNGEGVQKEIAKLEKLARECMPQYDILSIAYPFGEKPKKDYGQYALKGSYDGVSYEYKWALRASPCNNSANPNHIKFDVLNVPRVRGTDNAETDLGWRLRYYEENPQDRYISDGNPNTIVVPIAKESDLNKDALVDKELIIYGKLEEITEEQAK